MGQESERWRTLDILVCHQTKSKWYISHLICNTGLCSVKPMELWSFLSYSMLLLKRGSCLLQRWASTGNVGFMISVLLSHGPTADSVLVALTDEMYPILWQSGPHLFAKCAKMPFSEIEATKSNNREQKKKKT